MELKQVAALFFQAQKNVWPDNSTVVTQLDFAIITVQVGTDAEPVRIVITARRELAIADVEILTQRDPIRSVKTLAKLGGALIQASNLVDQANGLAGGSADVSA